MLTLQSAPVLASQVGAWKDGVWNEVFVGTINAPASHCGMDTETGSKPFVTVDSAPVVADTLPNLHISAAGPCTSVDILHSVLLILLIPLFEPVDILKSRCACLTLHQVSCPGKALYLYFIHW